MISPSKDRASEVGAFLLRVAGAVAGITFFFYLVGVAVEFRRLKTLDLPADGVVAALPHDLLLIIGIRSMVVPIALGGGAVLVIEMLHSAEGWGLRRVLAVLLAVGLALGAVAFVFLPKSCDLRIEHTVLIVLVAAIASVGWLLEHRLHRITHSGWFAFVATALAAALVAYLNALLPPVHLDYASVKIDSNVKIDSKKGSITGFYVGKNSDDVFLTPDVEHRDRTCGVLEIIPTREIVAISLTRARAIKVDKSHLDCPQ